MKGTIVVVEDEANIADLVGMYLEREGFRVLKCRDRAPPGWTPSSRSGRA